MIDFNPDINGSQMINHSDFGEPLTFPLALSPGQIFHLASKTPQHIFDGLAQVVQISMTPRQRILTLVIH